MKDLITILSLLIFLLIIGLFYWFAYRPSQIRKDCFNAMVKIINEDNKDNNTSEINSLYRFCLVKKGLKPENLTAN